MCAWEEWTIATASPTWGKLDNSVVASFGGCADWSLSMIVPYLGIIQYPIYIYVLAIAEVGLEPTTC